MSSPSLDGGESLSAHCTDRETEFSEAEHLPWAGPGPRGLRSSFPALPRPRPAPDGAGTLPSPGSPAPGSVAPAVQRGVTHARRSSAHLPPRPHCVQRCLAIRGSPSLLAGASGVPPGLEASCREALRAEHHSQRRRERTCDPTGAGLPCGPAWEAASMAFEGRGLLPSPPPQHPPEELGGRTAVSPASPAGAGTGLTPGSWETSVALCSKAPRSQDTPHGRSQRGSH